MVDSYDKQKDVASFYERHYDEDERLSRGYNRLEFVRSKEIINRHLPKPPATILDIGGGSGVYSFGSQQRVMKFI